MLTLQTTFVYDCPNAPLIGDVQIFVEHPRFSILSAEPSDGDTTGGDGPSRITASPYTLVGHRTITFDQKLLAKKYSVQLPTKSIFGEDYGTTMLRHLQYATGLNNSHMPKLADFTLPFSASYGDGYDSDQAVRFEGIYFLQAIPPPAKLERLAMSETTVQPSTTPVPAATATATATISPASIQPSLTFSPLATIPHLPTFPALGAARWAEIIESNIFVVNKDVYLETLQEIYGDVPEDSQAMLLYIINALADLTGPVPIPLKQSESTLRAAVANVTSSFSQSHRDGVDVYAHVMKKFPELFDLQLKMPCVKLLTVGGTFKINGSSEFQNYVFYHLTSEFSVLTTESDSLERIVRRYYWDRTKLQNGSLSFNFPEKQIMQNRVRGSVLVRLKSFDGTEVWTGEYGANDPVLQALDLVVDLQLPGFLDDPGSTADIASDEKLRGKVVAMDKYCGGLNGTVIVQAKKAADGLWQTVSAGESDKAGNFTLSYPPGTFTSARAFSVLDRNSFASIAVSANANDKSISTSFIFILLSGDSDNQNGVKSKDDCSCGPQMNAERLPSQEDLIKSDQYTQDVGGGCINLSTPNRVLREWSYTAIVRTSDPDVANYSLSSGTDSGGRRAFSLDSHGKVKRSTVDLNNPIQWQDVTEAAAELSLYQAVTVATGHVLHYRSEYRADGYSLGDLLYSLPLAPGQKKQIVVMDTQRDLLASEGQSVSQSESLAAQLVNERSIIDQVAGSIGEALAGRSTASTEGVSAGLGAAASYGGVAGASLGVAGGYSKSSSNASQNGKRDISQYFSEILRQGTMQNADSYRQLNASVVTAVREGQQFSTETEVIANHNHCHSLTMMYFEVLRHFAVFQSLVDVEECMFVPLLMTKFSMANIPKWRDILATNLRPTPSNTYLKPYSFFNGRSQHPLLPAFDALERVRDNWAKVDFPLTTYDQDVIRFIQGELVLSTIIPRPKTKWDFILSLPVITKTVTREVMDAKSVAKAGIAAMFTGGISLLFNQGTRTETDVVLATAKVFDAWFDLDATYETVPPARAMRFKSFDVYTPENGIPLDPIIINISHQDRRLWLFIAKALNYQDSNEGIRGLLTDYYSSKANYLSDWNNIFNSEIAPKVFLSIVDNLSIDIGSLDFTPRSRYNGGERRMTINFSGTSSKTRFDIQQSGVTISCKLQALKDLGNSDMVLNIASLRIAYSTQHFKGLIFSGQVNGDLWDGQRVPAPESPDEMRNPKDDDRVLTDKLIDHLNYFIEYYNRRLWLSLDPDRRFMLLDGFNIDTYDQYGTPEGLRSLASVVKNQLITVVGNSLVFPVAAGFHVSQSLVIHAPQQAGTEQVPDKKPVPSLLDHYKSEIEPPPYRISVPTKGVFMEAVMGNCNACEKVQADSSQDWTKFTADEPTPIAAVDAPVPAQTDWKAAFKDFAAPMINIQNAPSAPDPGAGLAGLNSILGKNDAFRDVTGLAANQQNAMATYQSNQENAKAFAQMASGMAMQAHNTSNSSKIMDSLTSANQSGALPDGDYKKLVKEHLQHQIDGGKSLNAELENQKRDSLKKPTLTDVAAAAEAKGKGVKATRTDGSGSTESLDVVGSGAPEVKTLAKVDGLIPALKQGKVRDCWAVSAAMMVDWQKQQTMPIEDVIRPAGEKYVTMYRDDTGLANADIEPFFTALGMVLEPPASYTIDAYVTMMNSYGPLWVVTDAGSGSLFSPHARVLVEIAGDGDSSGKNTVFTFLDPDTGRKDQDTFPDFVAAYERMVTQNKSSKLFLQIVHFSTEIPRSTSISSGNASSFSDTVRGRPVDIAQWVDLLTFKPPQSLVNDLAPRKMKVQKIEDAGANTVNLDYYPIKIDRFPQLPDGTTATPEKLLRYVRLHFNDFVDNSLSTFEPFKADIDAAKWNQDNPFGAVIQIDIQGPDNAAVAVAESDDIHWRFVTLETSFWDVGNHPVSGTREFGIRGGNTFYTRGADRATGFPESLVSNLAYGQGKKLWRSLQAKLGDWINSHEGSVGDTSTYTQKEENWDAVKQALTAGNTEP